MNPASWRNLCLQATAAILVASAGLWGLVRWGQHSEAGIGPASTDFGQPSGLPLPSTMSVGEFEDKLFAFLGERQYVQLGWRRDKGVRDTGPFVGGKYHGTHPAVRVYYSPGVMRWLVGGRVGPIPDGEMIIKEQFAAPAIRHDGKSEGELWQVLESWTVMVKDSSGSHDGWFWSNPVKGKCSVDNHRYPYDYPVSGFGQYCVRCHAATHSPGTEPGHAHNEHTFIALRNVAGYPGDPLKFRVDDSWRPRNDKSSDDKSSSGESSAAHPKCARPEPPARPVRDAHEPFLSFFGSVRKVKIADVAHLPPATHDWAVGRRDSDHHFVTSNQCMNCHAALMAPFGPSMFVPTTKNTDYEAPGWDVSPYGEWRWTAMGLAGRDPVFYAQLESEMALIKKEFGGDAAYAAELSATLTDTCLRCHGAMGKRQHDLDRNDASAKFPLDHVHRVAGAGQHPGHGDAKYGALARDGVSCAICHRMQPRPQPAGETRPYLQHFLDTSTSGHYHLGTKGEIYGPFKDDEITPYVMEHAMGLKPKHSEFLKSSQLCGTCHTIALPNIDRPITAKDPGHGPDDELIKAQQVPLYKKFHHHMEQATYLEWLNSEFENEIDTKNPKAKSCQDCHMSAGLKDEKHGIDIPQIRTRIAAIQDTTYPEAENLPPADKLNVRVREQGYRRHNFSGLNAFLVEMFNQFDDVLGVPKTDFMTGSKEGVGHAIDHIVRTARDDVATVDVRAERQGERGLTARVLIKNKVGHRFPSGVGFRRAFVELTVVETPANGTERIVWSSGRTNELGALIGADGQPLATEFFARDPKTNDQRFQAHHEVITSPDQVQVYETLLTNAKGEFTTSFVRGCETVKDNRLLPRGWKPEGPGPALTGRYLKATHPDPETAKDRQYADGSGSDETTYRIELPADVDLSRVKVYATLYYQSMPPYFLRNLFETAPDGPATQRLHHIASHLKLKGTPLENWKLRIGGATSDVAGR